MVLTIGPESRETVVIERTGPATCTLTFWLDKNQIMLAPATCSAGSAEDHAAIEAAVEIK